MEGPTILVLNHIYNRQMSYMSGVMTCRSTVNGVSLGDRLSRLTIEDLQLVTNKNTDNLNKNTKGLLKASSCCCITPIQIVQTSVKLKMSEDTLWLIRVRDTALVKKKKKQFKIS
jgi:hypothetical protein